MDTVAAKVMTESYKYATELHACIAYSVLSLDHPDPKSEAEAVEIVYILRLNAPSTAAEAVNLQTKVVLLVDRAAKDRPTEKNVMLKHIMFMLCRQGWETHFKKVRA